MRVAREAPPPTTRSTEPGASVTGPQNRSMSVSRGRVERHAPNEHDQ